ncbi:hypothetical protein ILYODFUR_033549 [Ilyodon furcidens]|uniref:Uncharacterized protein n=1 Tax=Ilyodon furcidens TaxID=33524 RepID=A0ABV0UAL6_9TELE
MGRVCQGFRREGKAVGEVSTWVSLHPTDAAIIWGICPTRPAGHTEARRNDSSSLGSCPQDSLWTATHYHTSTNTEPDKSTNLIGFCGPSTVAFSN